MYNVCSIKLPFIKTFVLQDVLNCSWIPCAVLHINRHVIYSTRKSVFNVASRGDLIWTHQLQYPPAGLQTSQDARFYSMSSRFDDFSNHGQPLVIQFTVKHEQSIDCGGGYIKLFPSGLSQEELHGDSVYNIMFGQWN